ncbi:MAG TPA: copper resistance CopC family protein [Acidobacteriaceae bacterium]|nr:copper resistance CopC family protein [Acidobacteriaceae bacterium]
MRRISPGFVAVIAVFAWILAFAPKSAWAHAVLVSAQPRENSTVAGPQIAVVLKYNSRVDVAHSTLSLLAPDGKVDKVTLLGQSAPDLLSAKLSGLSSGAYVLRWQVLASDGHITRGEIPFQVK